MSGIRYVYWQAGGLWIGYLEEFPDYLTQGESFEDLQEHLRDLYGDLNSGEIPGVRRVAELVARPSGRGKRTDLIRRLDGGVWGRLLNWNHLPASERCRADAARIR